MVKVEKTILTETKYIAIVTVLLSVLLNACFLIFRKWDYTVFLGTLLSALVAVINFLLMGITIQKALEKDSSDAKKMMKASQSMRNFGMLVIIGTAVSLPCFNTIAVIVPIFFPRIAIMLRPLWKKKEEEVIKE
ncbi:MAG: hypothetical protein J6Q27_01880 [Clostridia bacterium]|nr:hypothetical protein [Clostridia bacterium]